MLSSIKNWFYASIFLAIITVVWIGLVLGKSLVLLPVTFIAIFRDTDEIFGKTVDWKGWRYHMWISDDQNINAILGGNADITISSRLGYHSVRGNPIAKRMAKVVDLLFKITVGQENHCEASIEKDEVHHSVWGK